MENAVPAQSKLKGFLRRPAVMIGLGACAVASTFVFLTVSGQGPKVSHSTIPIPFIPGENHGAAAGNGLAGSVTYVRTLANGVEFYEMDFVGDSSQLAPADKVYLVKVPAGVTSIPFERVVLDSNGATRPYYGYIYTSSSAATEIANQTATGFAVRFPGLFFASAAVKAAHGTDLDAFASINGIVFKTSTQFDTGSGARLRGPQLIALVPTDQNLLIDIAPVCGNSWKAATEDCDDGNVDNGDGCSSTCTIESGFTCDATSEQSVCTPAPVCGDGFKTQGETCDDGCSATCTVETGYVCDTGTPNICTKTCGDGTRGQGEACDDGNDDSGDGCSATCTVENGYSCNTDTPNVCDPNGANAVCGNSVREGDLCGNQFVDNDEECDWAVDCANVADGDTCACHADCTICDGNEDCTFNAPNYNGETCDDGDTDAGDGCNASCDVENGYSCDTASPNVCSFYGNVCSYQTIGDLSLSDDGRFAAYLTAGSGATTDFQVVLYDRVADTSVAVTDINAALADGVPNWADAGPYISGDGRYLAFDGIVTGFSKKLTIYDRVNDTYAVLATSGSFMQLSDDGNALVYQYQGCIIAYDKTSGNYTNLAGPNANCLSGVTPVTNNGDPIVTTTETPYEGVVSGNGRYAFFLVPNTGVPEILGSPQKDIYRVDLTNGTTVVAATAQVGSHLNVTADGNIVIYSFTVTGEYDEASYNFTTQTSSEFDLQGVLTGGGLDTNVEQISSDGTIYQIFGGLGPNGVRQAVYSATTQQVIYEVPDVLNAFIFLSGDGNNLAYVSDTPGGPTGHWSVFVRNIVQDSTKIAPSLYQCQ